MPVSEGPAPEGPQTVGQPADVAGRHTHPLTAVTSGLVLALPGTVGLLFTILRDGEVPEVPWWVLLLAPIVLLVVSFVAGTAYGYVSWRFTTYVIDGSELRVESGVLFRSSRRVPYERLQSVDIAEPLLARVVGLCELRMETAGGADSRTDLRFLKLADARDLRRLLLDRAHGTRAGGRAESGAGVESAPGPDEQRRVLLTVAPQRLLLGTLVSLDFALTVLAGLVLLVAAIALDLSIAVFGAAIPFATVLLRIVSGRVVAQWGFTLSEGERGLRIERGLLSRTSQTIPWERVQGIAMEEPLVWRGLGWARLRVDVAGYGTEGSDESGESTSTLAPIADRAVAVALLDHVLHVRPDDLEHQAAPPARSWPFAPIGWRYRWVGAGATSFVAVQGWVQRRTNVVPHHKTQSVEVRQGPLQRLLGVASTEVHTPQGPVDADAEHLPAEQARAVALEQLARAREARASFLPPKETAAPLVQD